MKIRPAITADLPAIRALECGSPSAAHWSESQYQGLFEPGAAATQRFVLVACESSAPTPDTAQTVFGGDVAGFLVARHIAPEWELENIVVAQAARRRGIGRQLLEALLTAARKANSDAVFLEVRESNLAARNLYERLGFRQVGRRTAYYSNPVEDAILFRKDLSRELP